MLEVFGTKATLKASTPVMPQISPIVIESSNKLEPFEQIQIPHGNELQGPGKNVAYLYENFAEKIVCDSSFIPDFKYALRIQKLLDIALESNASKKTISM
ncbi:MAG: hypothetical protein AB8G05_26310 [Oligoflexales bacterium]